MSFYLFLNELCERYNPVVLEKGCVSLIQMSNSQGVELQHRNGSWISKKEKGISHVGEFFKKTTDKILFKFHKRLF